MFVAVWRFRVEEKHRPEFEAAYGSAGDWARLFAGARGYLGTELLRGGEGAYLTIDRWRDAASWERFRREQGAAYLELDRRCEQLTLEERQIGAFTPVNA